MLTLIWRVCPTTTLWKSMVENSPVGSVVLLLSTWFTTSLFFVVFIFNENTAVTIQFKRNIIPTHSLIMIYEHMKNYFELCILQLNLHGNMRSSQSIQLNMQANHPNESWCYMVCTEISCRKISCMSVCSARALRLNMQAYRRVRTNHGVIWYALSTAAGRCHAWVTKSPTHEY